MAKTAAKDVPIEEKALATQSADNQIANSVLDMFQEDQGMGSENITGRDMSTPFLSILQKNSPQVDRVNGKYIKEAQQGMIMNTVSNKLYDGELGVEFVPCGFTRTLVEWTPREKGGGLIGHHTETSEIVRKSKPDERGRLVTPEGNLIIDTAYHFGLLLDEEFAEAAVIGMSSSSLKQSRLWNTMIKRLTIKDKNGKPFNPPSFSHVYRLTTKGFTKDQFSWFGWGIEMVRRVDDISVYTAAKQVAQAVADGSIRVSAPPSEETEAEASATGDPVPF